MATREDQFMRPYRLLVIALALTILLSGCVYVHTVEPLTVDMDRTSVSSVEKTGSIQVIAFPYYFTSVGLVAWGNDAIGEVSKQQGMKEVYYADLEIFSILRIWNQYTVHVYGK
jgi:hypothetical protein